MQRAERVVVALGGNALQQGKEGATAQAQWEVVRRTCGLLAEIVMRGYEIALVHGNGPQVGRILLASEVAGELTPAMPLDVCNAMSQGYIGYHIQQGMRTALEQRGRGDIPVVTLVTRVVVDGQDPGFRCPEKPIGPFYTEGEAARISADKGYTMKRDGGRGIRRVVASPRPVRICEMDVVRKLWDTTIVIACGGGGIPVVETEEGLQGVAAVVDKDHAARLLAQEAGADCLLILTGVEKVSLHFGQPQQEDLDFLPVEEALHYMEEGHFAPGSMLPKVQAAVEFATSRPGRRAVITSLYKAVEALEGKTGTHIVARPCTVRR